MNIEYQKFVVAHISTVSSKECTIESVKEATLSTQRIRMYFVWVAFPSGIWEIWFVIIKDSKYLSLEKIT